MSLNFGTDHRKPPKYAIEENKLNFVARIRAHISVSMSTLVI